MSVVTKYLLIFVISMVPVVELRGAVPVSQVLGLPVMLSYVVCIIGNMIPVPFIYLLARRILIWGSTKRFIGKFFTWCLNKGERGGQKLLSRAGRGMFIALLLFVGIPLPGTGAWTGTLAASILDLDFKMTAAAAMCGVLLAGVIMMTLSSFGVTIFLR